MKKKTNDPHGSDFYASKPRRNPHLKSDGSIDPIVGSDHSAEKFTALEEQKRVDAAKKRIEDASRRVKPAPKAAPKFTLQAPKFTPTPTFRAPSDAQATVDAERRIEAAKRGSK